jgi:hypothetical protein
MAQQMARLVEQKVILHAREVAGLHGQTLKGRQPVPGTHAACPDLPLQIGKRRCAEQLGNARRHLRVQPGQSAQRRHFGDTGEARHRQLTRWLRQPYPGREQGKLIQRRAALPGQRLGPLRRQLCLFALGRVVADTIEAGHKLASEFDGAGRQALKA